MEKPRKFKNLYPGVYAPLPTFFNAEQNLDLESYRHHLLNLATKGIIPVCSGSLGEAVHLDPVERVTLIQFIRKCLDDAGLKETPIVAGVGGLSTRETIRLSKEAAEAGADAGMVILPAYYAASLKTDEKQIVQYYVDICAGSPIPILLYNFPSNAAGLDMSSAVIEAVMRNAQNLGGVKLTCGGSIAKLMRLKATIDQEPSINASRQYPFLLLDGLIADLEPWMSCGGHGTVSGMSNFAPIACTRLLKLCQSHSRSAEEDLELSGLQAALSLADVAAVPSGVRGMKYALHKLHGFGPAPRRPLLPLDEEDGEAFMRALQPVLQIENALAAEHSARR